METLQKLRAAPPRFARCFMCILGHASLLRKLAFGLRKFASQTRATSSGRGLDAVQRAGPVLVARLAGGMWQAQLLLPSRSAGTALPK